MSQSNAPFDSYLMARAVELARNARPSPNPRVGAVVATKGRIVGEGFHQRPGTPHAEVLAIAEAGKLTQGADLYVTLEPCVHHGRTGPCVEQIVRSGISRVAIGVKDPDVRVNGRGISFLQHAGIEVHVGIEENSCRELLFGYAIHRRYGRPGVTLKAAVTLDGYLATNAGDSKWISSEASRIRVHEMRADADAVLVGIDTVLRDDPQLTVRDATGVSPLRIVLDSRLRCPKNSKLIESAERTPVLLVHSLKEESSVAVYQAIPGVETVYCEPASDGRVNISRLMEILSKKGLLSVLVEGGAKVFGSFIRAKAADRLILFVAPIILGNGIPWVSMPTVSTIADGIRLHSPILSQIGDDLVYRISLRNSSIWS